MFLLRPILMLLLIATAMALAATTPSRAAACDVAMSSFTQAQSSGDLDKAASIYAQLSATDAGCSEHVIHCEGDNLARAYLNASYEAADNGASVGDVGALLTKGQTFGSPWQLLVGQGDMAFSIAHSSKVGADYEKAAGYYQDALNLIAEDPVCADLGEPPAPSNADIGPIHQRMTEALLLAPQFDVTRTRDGNCGGVFLASVRGFTPTFRPIPIDFDFDKTTFTAEGQKAASVLLGCVKEEHYSSITLSGHTDDLGTAPYNMELSKHRLDAVAQFLRAGGYAGKLVLEPKGESEPFQPDDPTAYDADEIRQLNRRVALRETEK